MAQSPDQHHRRNRAVRGKRPRPTPPQVDPMGRMPLATWRAIIGDPLQPCLPGMDDCTACRGAKAASAPAVVPGIAPKHEGKTPC